MGEAYCYDRTDVWENPRLLRHTPKRSLYPRAVRWQNTSDEVVHQPLYFEIEGGDAWSDTARGNLEEKNKDADLTALKMV